MKWKENLLLYCKTGTIGECQNCERVVYFSNDNEGTPFLTNKAPPEAVESYNQYLEQFKLLAVLEG